MHHLSYNSLISKQIAGAGLDVFLYEPLPSKHPFMSLDNVILCPHIGGGSGGARINHIFEIEYKKAIQKIDPFDNLSDDDIRTAIKNSGALRPALFVPEGAFEILIKQ